MPEYVEYLIIAIASLVVIVAGLAVYLLVKVQYITQYFNNRKFKLSMKLEVDPVSHKDKFVFHIFNNNLNDARVSDLGIGYDQESITFYKDKLNTESLTEEDWLVIPTRDSISVEIDVKQTYELILERNKGIYRLKKVRIYVIDAAGFETRVRARDFVKTIKKMLKADRKIIRQARRKIRLEKFKAFFDFKAKNEARLANKKIENETSVPPADEGKTNNTRVEVSKDKDGTKPNDKDEDTNVVKTDEPLDQAPQIEEEADKVDQDVEIEQTEEELDKNK